MVTYMYKARARMQGVGWGGVGGRDPRKNARGFLKQYWYGATE